MRYHNITKDDMLNGDGLRVVLWVSGCTHACNECHNSITWDLNGGLPFDNAAKEELFAELKKDYIQGVTLSGGDPLHPSNRNDIASLIEEIHTLFPTKTIWLYTGFNFEEIKSLPFIPYLDVIVDGKFVKELNTNGLHWKGSSNQRVIDVKQTLKENKLIIWSE